MKKLTKRGECLVLKVVGPNGESHGGFIWPLDVGAVVEAPDWRPTVACGNGLHGWHYGAGKSDVAGARVEAADSRWLLLVVDESTVIDLDGKVKFPRCRLAFVAAESGPTGRAACVSLLNHYAPRDKAVMWGSAAAGYAGSAAAGYAGSAAVEADGLATSGVGGIVKGGANAVLVALYSTGGERSDFDYSVGQVGKSGIEAGVWYEGSPQGLKVVAGDDWRVRTFNERWERLQSSKVVYDKAIAEANEKADAAGEASAKLEAEVRAKIVPPTPPKKAGA